LKICFFDFRAFRASVVKRILQLRISIAECGSFLLRALEGRSSPSIKSAHEKAFAAASRRDGRDGDAGVRVVKPPPSQQAPQPFQSPSFFASHELRLLSYSARDSNFQAGVNVTAGLELSRFLCHRLKPPQE